MIRRLGLPDWRMPLHRRGADFAIFLHGEGSMADKSPSDARLKVFISYSRRDVQMADQLVQALEASEFDVLIDRRDLPYGEEWQMELADFIRSSDTVVWLVSPDSVNSKLGAWRGGAFGQAPRPGARQKYRPRKAA
jgi:hypothetical protein